MGTPLRRKPPASEMAEAELHKERLQALAEKRKRQAEIEDKRRQLEDLILQLQHLKSKAMRERWLLQGAPAGTQEEEEVRRRQAEEDEMQVKKLEDSIHRLEGEIGLLESEESQISAKEQVLRERLKETERSIEDLQKSLQQQDGDAVNYVSTHNPDLPELYSQTVAKTSGDEQLPRKAAMYAVEISVEKDKKTGGTKILSASPVSPEEVHQRGVKVYDDGRKVVYEVRSGGSTTLENGLHPWNSVEVDELMQRVGQSRGRGDSGGVTVTPAGSGPAGTKEQTVHKEAKLEMIRGPQGKGTGDQPKYGYEGEVTEVPEASSEKPVTMIFMGYHSVDDEEETKKLLGFDGTIKAEIVLIDEDDEKSLREKTVTDISTMDGNAADLVSGRPLSDTTELSSEGKDESSAKELPPAGSEPACSGPVAEELELVAGVPSKTPHTALKPSKVAEDDSELKGEKFPKSVSFLDSVSVISGGKSDMDLDASFPEAQPDVQHACYPTSGQNGMKNRHESLDSDVAKEIRYLDEVLEANCCDPLADATTNGTSSPDLTTINVDGTGPSVQVSGMLSPQSDEVIVEGKKQTTFIGHPDSNDGKPNGHSGMEDQGFKRLSVEPSVTTIKKEARFELRAFQEDKKPSKLFESSSEKEPVRMKKVRQSEEIAELERERRELIRGQAVKKNPGIAAKWWNPPQEKMLEEELDPEQLESLKRYEERKQRKPETASMPEISSKQTAVSIVPPEPGQREDVVMEQIDFSAARKQFLQMEPAKQPGGPKRGVAPQLYSAKPFSRASEVTHVEKPSSSVTVASNSYNAENNIGEVTTIRTERIHCSPGDSPIPQVTDSVPESVVKDSSKAWTDDGDFTCARAVMTILKEEDSDIYPLQQTVHSSSHPEEIDSGLDDLSLRSQDTTVLETLSNDFSMDNVSDSGASNETMNAFLENSLGDYSFPTTPQATTPINGKMDGGTKSPTEYGVCPSFRGASLTEEQLEYHAGILVQNAIQQAIAQQSDEWRSFQAPEHPSPIPERHVRVAEQPPPPSEAKAKFEPSQASSPVHEWREVTPEITVQAPAVSASMAQPQATGRSQSPPPSEKQEFSYFSKYSEAAELRSTASVNRAQEMEVSSGPFRLRSRKQRTLSMIEEEIRAAQEREEELKRQRQTQAMQVNTSHKSKTNSLPARQSVTGKTVPGKIEKIRTVPVTSPASEGPLPSPLSDTGSDDSGASQRPKNFMQTLMEDYETHKVKRREKIEDNRYARLLLSSDVTSEVLEATRVTRRKSNMALRWEAGIYANQDEEEEEE
ncbi:A-kinase anchor protein 2 isoform X1 [Megalops cyprinoides]|uniref:A-kinase anchor protein 2 isoform X1 n=1 Tax=Megalops cyprinoides TaxID=118141 RepID=UPI001863E16D|nr:A-kinase anchor protein 2 isoform X1 [Megalops cyprinoides]